MTSDRREVLRLLLTCGLLLRSPIRLGSLAELPTREPESEELVRLLQLLSQRESVERIGGEYLRTHPQMATSRALMLSIQSKLHLREEMGAKTLDAGQVAGRLRETIREDFSASRTVSIGGWLLSETEVQLCGLYAVSASAGIV